MYAPGVPTLTHLTDGDGRPELTFTATENPGSSRPSGQRGYLYPSAQWTVPTAPSLDGAMATMSEFEADLWDHVHQLLASTEMNW